MNLYRVCWWIGWELDEMERYPNGDIDGFLAEFTDFDSDLRELRRISEISLGS